MNLTEIYSKGQEILAKQSFGFLPDGVESAGFEILTKKPADPGPLGLRSYLLGRARQLG